MKTLNLTIHEGKVGCYTHYQEIFEETEKGTEIDYRVCDLIDCPEDATICRDLFSAEQFVRTLRLGMKLAEEGYKRIKIIHDIEEE